MDDGHFSLLEDPYTLKSLHTALSLAMGEYSCHLKQGCGEKSHICTYLIPIPLSHFLVSYFLAVE